MKKICVVTATRAEYGLLKRLIEKISIDTELELILVVTGTHLSKEYGYTIQEIENDGFEITEKIPAFLDDSTEKGICEAMGRESFLFAELYEKHNPDLLVVLGDRYELLPICNAGMIYRIPIAHIAGGELTEGLIDDAVRHCITKMSYLHFAGCETYRKRIIQLGENPDRVFNVGDTGVENVYKMDFMKKSEVEKMLNISLDGPYASVTFHPVTLEKNTAEEQTKKLVSALKEFENIKFIVTMANADQQGQIINQIFENASLTVPNIFFYKSLGSRGYLSLLKYAEFVIGNSSSGIAEVPCFGIPTINIGDRQKGRLQADSIINCKPEINEIKESIEKAMSLQFREKARNTKNPYGSGNSSEEIINIIKSFLCNGHIDLKKKFFDIKIE